MSEADSNYPCAPFGKCAFGGILSGEIGASSKGVGMPALHDQDSTYA